MPGMKSIVVSHTLKGEDHPKLTIIGDDLDGRVSRLRQAPGKDIWLFGGGGLFRSMLDLRLVDAIEVAVIPVLLGDGVSLLPPGDKVNLRLVESRVYSTTGTTWIHYAVDG